MLRAVLKIFIILILPSCIFVSDCPKYIFSSIDFGICKKTKYYETSNEEVNLNCENSLVDVDTLFKNKEYSFIIKPHFEPVHDTTKRLFNFCAGPDNISRDSLLTVSIIMHSGNERITINDKISILNDSSFFCYYGKEVAIGQNVVEFIDHYNELMSGYGDFYIFYFERLGFNFLLGDNVKINSHIKIEVLIEFRSGKKLRKSHSFFIQ